MTNIEQRARQLMQMLEKKRRHQARLIYRDGSERTVAVSEAVIAIMDDNTGKITKAECGAGHGLLASLMTGVIEEVPG